MVIPLLLYSRNSSNRRTSVEIDVSELLISKREGHFCALFASLSILVAKDDRFDVMSLMMKDRKAPSLFTPDTNCHSFLHR